MKVALVTGGGKGIGAGICRLLSEEYAVIINYNKSEKQAKALEKELRDKGRTAEAVFADITDLTDIKKMIDYIVSRYHKIDALVNNSGVSSYSLIQDVTEKEYDYVMDCNLKGGFFVTKEVAEQMIKRKTGSVVFISSMWGECGASMESVYSASKGGLIALTKSLAKELAPSGIRVNCVAPGVIDTDMFDFDSDIRRKLIENTPLERIGKDYDVAATVKFLLSDEASFITGQVLGVNGGYHI